MLIWVICKAQKISCTERTTKGDHLVIRSVALYIQHIRNYRISAIASNFCT